MTTSRTKEPRTRQPLDTSRATKSHLLGSTSKTNASQNNNSGCSKSHILIMLIQPYTLNKILTHHRGPSGQSMTLGCPTEKHDSHKDQRPWRPDREPRTSSRANTENWRKLQSASTVRHQQRRTTEHTKKPQEAREEESPPTGDEAQHHQKQWWTRRQRLSNHQKDQR